MSKKKYLLVAAFVVVSVALVVKQYERVNREVAEKMGKETVQKRTFGLFSALHGKDEVSDESYLMDDPVPVVPSPTPAAQPPADGISAEAFVVGNLETGEVYSNRQAASVFPIASVSKLYTSLIARHVMDPEKPVEITQTALDTYGDAGHLVLGEKFSPDELLRPLVMESSNDAAEAFAESYGYAQFTTEMNAFAQEIGMESTSFKDASGLNPGNVSSAKDLFAFSQYLYKYERPLLEVTRTREYMMGTTTEHGYHRFLSINPFTLNPYFIGGKTGRTNEAGESMVSLFHFQTNGKTYPIVIIVLRSRWSEREADTSRLLEKFMQSIGATNVMPVK